MPRTWGRVLPAVAGLVVFLVALEVLRAQLHALSWSALVADIRRVPPSGLILALLFTVANYAVLTGYDFLAFASIGKRLPARLIAAVSFLSYAVAHNIGLPMLSGASVRYRFYSRYGVTGEELSRIVLSYSVTFWLGLLALGGLSVALAPLPPAAWVPSGPWVAAIGWALVAVVVAYLGATVLWRQPVRIGRFDLSLPTPAIGLTQLVISSIDWALAGAVLFVLLPPSTLSFPAFLGSFMAAVLLGMASHVPGGLGVFEGVLTWLLGPFLAPAQLVPALVVFRGVYYLLPLMVALTAFLGHELFQRRAQASRVTAAFGRITERMTPRVLGALTFLAGLVLLVSGATPAVPERLDWLHAWLPLHVIEFSHFQGSVAGALLLLLSQGLGRRLDAAFYLACGALGVGILSSLLKGLDYEEALVLAVVLVALIRARPAFVRRAAFWETRFSPSWMATVLAALGASLWLGLFAFKHVEYAHELWWQFELHGEASRFLRGSTGAAVVLLLFGFARLIRHAPHEVTEPDDDQLSAAARVIASQPATVPNLAFLRDKGLLFNEDRTAFVMYGVQGRSWIAMGDPVGPASAVPDMISLFLSRCDDFGAVPVFYEATTAYLHHYADFGLTFVKLGEEARVNLQALALDGPSSARFRQAIRRLEKDGATFRVIAPSEVPGVIDELRQISDDWRSAKTGAEKGFSLGFFDAAYLARYPIAAIERGGRIEAFANIWLGAGRGELSVDLMRFRHDAPKNVMEALLVHVMRWGKTEGFAWFVLGMAPLSGFQRGAVTSLWTRLGAFVYQHGEPVFNFQGLRAFKEKFDPTWQPRYVVYPGGITLPRVLADASALIAGGYRQIFLS